LIRILKQLKIPAIGKVPLVMETGKVNYSAFSIIIRLFIAGYLIYWLDKRLMT